MKKVINAYKNNEKKIYGYTTIFNIIELPKALELDLTVLYPSKSDYNSALKISTELLKMGKPIQAIDIIAIAINNNLRVVTGDISFVKEVVEDFEVDLL